MAPFSNYTLLALLVAFAVVSPNLLHQSAAARDGRAANAAEAPAPSSANDGEVVLDPTSTTIDIPDLPIPGILPCPPAFPKIPFIPCYNVTPPPPPPTPTKECAPPLVTLMPLCSGFLTNTSSGAINDPSKECCDGVSRFSIGGDPSFYDVLCLCHVINGDVNQLLTAPVNHARALHLVHACLGIDPQQAPAICNDDSIKKMTPPMELPKPPTAAPGNKA